MKKKRRGKLSVILICIMFILYGCRGEGAPEVPENPGVRVTFFDVGKGDAILIETAGHCMLIDTGYDDTRNVILDYLAGQNIKKVDCLILTHFDKDHVGGADHILEAVEVEEVWQPGYESDSRQYQEYCQAMERKGMRPVIIDETRRVSFDGAQFLVYPPQQEIYEEEDNDFSLVVSMSYGDRNFLFAGDSERERLKELMDQEEFELAHDLLKVPHHGRKEKNSEEFLEAVSPKIAVITCSEEKMVDQEVRETLEGMDTEIYLTLNGTVTVLCSGDELEAIQSPGRR